MEEKKIEKLNGDSDSVKTNDSNQRNLVASFKDFIATLWNFSKETLSFTDEVDKSATVKMIKSEIQFKGFNIWILIFSIIIASIGLNTNSTAVIIGAMLISPLMGPIMGVGLSLGTNDWGTLVISFRALLITVFVSLLTSTLYFLITPFGEAGDELLGRTHPELRDVFIAIFGGLAGIMANTRNKATNVIPGVAIATALMPPLCTAGYGIATLNWSFFSGAFYLFIINSVYIALTAFIVIRYLKFPLVHLMDELKEKKFKRYIFVFSILLIVPSIYTLYKSYQKNQFETNAQEFVKHYFDDREMHHPIVDYNDGFPIIDISLIGKAKQSIEQYQTEMERFNLDASMINFTISEDKRIDEVLDKINNQKYEGPKFFEDMYSINLQQIKMLQNQNDSLITNLISIQADTIPFESISKELKINYPEVESFEYGVYKTTDFKTTKEIPTFHLKWNKKANNRKSQQNKIQKWLKHRLKLKEARVVSF
tara:strand:+ start:1935 stop:3380 length:1446 start_codon:yes stop_codon:yes gene_type:complete